MRSLLALRLTPSDGCGYAFESSLDATVPATPEAPWLPPADLQVLKVAWSPSRATSGWFAACTSHGTMHLVNV